MSLAALVTWVLTVLAGLFLLAIWLIEYDPDIQRAAGTRLPVPVIISHVLLAVSGLALWVGYLIIGDDRFAWGAFAVLGGVVTLGLIMAVRWIIVRRSGPNTVIGPGSGFARAGRDRAHVAVPPERHFPVSVVIGHGVLAVTTVTLVLLSNLGVGGS
jgi:hypothetical protein